MVASRITGEIMLKRLLFAASLLAGLGISSAMAAPDGAQLYGRNCAACHGENGNGGIGVPLALPSFQAGISDDYLRKTIHLGRPGRVMPAFPALEDAEVDAIVRYVRSWNRGISATYSAERVTGDPAHGRKLFAQYCAACHGAEGEGSKGTGVTFSRPRDLPIMAPALHNRGFLAAAPDAMIKATLMRVPRLSLADNGAAMMAEASLGAALDAHKFEVAAEYLSKTDSHRLRITRHAHGNVHISFLEADLLETGDYNQLVKVGDLLRDLMGPGARARRGEKEAPVHSFREAMDWFLAEVKRGISIQRYKGLGEMNPEQLWETTMDPKVRRLMKVQIEDAISSDQIFTTLMGDEVEPRRNFIETNAMGVRNLDV